MRQFHLPDINDEDDEKKYTLLDLPLLIEMNDDEFDAIADLEPGEEIEVSDYQIKRVS